MRLLILGDAEKKAIDDLIALAKAKPLTAEHIKRLSAGFDPADHTTREGLAEVIPTEFTIDIPQGYRVTYTEEEQPAGLCRHLSVSVSGEGHLPHPLAIQMLLNEFGFEHKLGEHQMVWPENYGAGLTAVNVLEPMEMADAAEVH